MTEGLEGRAAPPPGLGQRLDDQLTRFGVTSVLGRDSVLAVVVGLVSLGLFAALTRISELEPSMGLTSGQAAVITVVGFCQALPLCLRRVRPGLCFALIMVFQLVLVVAAPDVMARALSPLIAAYTLGSIARVRFTVAAGAIGAVAEGAAAAFAVRGWDEAPTVVANHFTSSAIAFAASAFIGFHIAARRRHLAVLFERAEDAVRAQRERTRAAVAAERTSIARELHDVAAHHLSGMVVQAAAVERLIDRDAEAAKSGAAWIRSQGKSTLDNLRQVVGLLRDDGEAEHAPIPGLSALDDLVAEAGTLGDRVELERTGTARRLPPIADIALYRIAQQSLTNARQHAPGATVRIRLAYGENDVELDVSNGPGLRPVTAAGERGGAGLVGMRERADLVGAAFTAEPSPDGGWRVQTRLTLRDRDRNDESGADA